MGKLIFNMSMSLDGLVAGPNDGPENPMGDGGMRLFQWYYGGDTDFQFPGTDMMFKISRASADLLQESTRAVGAVVTGRKTFDIARGWGGKPPLGVPTFVVTHTVPQEWVKPGSPFTFVTEGVESAVEKAKQAAGDKDVVASTATLLQQCLNAGLLDEIHLDLVPVLLGAGVRLFDNLGAAPIELERTRVVEALGVTHLRFRVVKKEKPT
ncbi:MAG: dihydrofolate reductase family protein [Gammaproteobacteria bacterium]